MKADPKFVRDWGPNPDFDNFVKTGHTISLVGAIFVSLFLAIPTYLGSSLTLMLIVSLSIAAFIGAAIIVKAGSFDLRRLVLEAVLVSVLFLLIARYGSNSMLSRWSLNASIFVYVLRALVFISMYPTYISLLETVAPKSREGIAAYENLVNTSKGTHFVIKSDQEPPFGSLKFSSSIVLMTLGVLLVLYLLSLVISLLILGERGLILQTSILGVLAMLLALPSIVVGTIEAFRKPNSGAPRNHQF